MKKSNKLTAAVTASVVASTLVAPAAFAASTDFTDIGNSYAKDAINELVEAGILNGVGNGQFNPTGKITRQDFAIILAKALNLDTTDAPANPTFKDVPASHYSYKFVEAAVKAELIAGTGNGTFGLNANLTRQDMAVLFVRALGVETEGLGDKLTFADADKIAGYAKDAVGFVVEAGLMSGMPGNTFAPTGLADRQQVALVTSKVLAYQAPVEAAEIKSVTYTDDKTLTVEFTGEVADLKASDLTVAVAGTNAAVKIDSVTASEDKKSVVVKVEKLIGGTTFEVSYKGKKSSVKSPDKLEVVAAKQAGSKKFTVEFTQPAADLEFAIKRGSINVVADKVEWNDNKTVATVTTIDNLTTAEYTLTVTGKDFNATKAVKAEAQRIADLNIEGEVLAKSTDTAVSYKVLNQFGEEMKVANSRFTFVATQGTLVRQGSGNAEDKLGLNLSNDAIKVDSLLTLTILDGTTGVNKSKTFKVGEAVKVKSFKLKEVKLAKDVTRLAEGTTGTTVDYEAIDQYGNVITAKSVLDTVEFVDSSANAALAWDTVEGKQVIKLTVANDIAADETVIATSVFPGGETSQLQFKIYDSAAPANVAVDGISSVVAQGDTGIAVPLNVTDQFGTALTAKEIATKAASFTITNTNSAVINAVSIPTTGENAGKLVFNAVGKGTATLQVLINGTGKSATLTVNVEEARHISKIELKNKPAGKLLLGATTDVQYKLYDQYGKEVPATDKAGYNVILDLTKVAGTDGAVTVANSNGDNVTTGANLDESAVVGETFTVTGAKTGEYKLVAKVVSDDGASTLSTVTSNFKVVDGKDEVLTYNVADIPTLFKGNNAAYAAPVKVEATDAAGVKVAIPTATIANVMSDSELATITNVGGYKVQGNNANGSADVKATVTVVLNTPQGTQVVKKEVTVSASALAATKVAFVDADDKEVKSINATMAELATGINLFDDAGYELVISDQFEGTSLTTTGNAYLTAHAGDLTFSDNESISLTAGTIRILAGDTAGIATTGTKFTVTAVTANGKSEVITVNIVAGN